MRGGAVNDKLGSCFVDFYGEFCGSLKYIDKTSFI